MMKEVLTRSGFTESEITTLEAREDYETQRTRIERLQADSLLDDLEARIESRTEALEGTLDEKWETFIAQIDAIESGDSENNQPETLEEMRTCLESEAIEKVDTSIKNQFASVPFIGEWIAETLIEQRKNFLTPSEGTGGSIKNWFVMFVAGMFGFNSVFQGLQKEIEAAKNAVLPEVEVPVNIDGGKIEVSDKLRDATVYTSGVELIMGLSEDDNDTTEQLLNQPSVKESTFSTIVGEDFTLEGIEGKDITALKATLRSQEGLIDSILGTESPEWRNLTLLEIFGEIGVYGKTIGGLDNLSPEDILSGDFSIGSLSLGEFGAIGGTFGALFERYRNTESSIFHEVSEGLFVEIVRENRKKITDSDVASLFSTNSFESEQDSKFEVGFIEFGKGFINTIVSDFYLGPDEHREAFEAFIRDKSLTYKEILEFMILTGGSLDTGGYNDAVKTIIYTKIWGLLGEGENWENSIRSDTYNAAFRAYMQNGVAEGMENVPPQVFIVGRRLLGTIQNNVERVAEDTGNMILEMWRFLGFEGQLIVAGTSAAILLALFRSRLFLARASGLGMGLQVGIIGTLVFMARNVYANTEFRTTYPEIESEEALINTALLQLQKDGIDLTEGVERLRSGELGLDIDHSQIAALGAVEAGGDTPVTVEGVEVGRREYPSFMINTHKLENDGMEIIPANGHFYEHTHGNLTIRKDRRDRSVSFLVNDVERNTYFSSEGGFWDGVSDNLLEDSILVKDDGDEVFLGIIVGRSGYTYISVKDLEQKINSSDSGKILIAKDLYFGWDLMMAEES